MKWLNERNCEKELKEQWAYIDTLDISQDRKDFIKKHPFMLPTNWRELRDKGVKMKVHQIVDREKKEEKEHGEVSSAYARGHNFILNNEVSEEKLRENGWVKKVKRKNGQWQCSHVKEDVIDGNCPYCKLTVAEGAVESFQKGKVKGYIKKSEVKMDVDKVKSIMDKFVYVGTRGKTGIMLMRETRDKIAEAICDSKDVVK